MEKQLKESFLNQWGKYFPGAELPVAYYYAGEVSEKDLQDTKNEHRCLICNLNRVREGHAFVYSSESPGCLGGKRYTGFSQRLRPNFEYFLSCGIPGKMEGERYKKSPEIVEQLNREMRRAAAPAKYLVFKRWDKMEEGEEPAAVVFFAEPDVLSGLFTLANFRGIKPYSVITPFSAGCGSIIRFPLMEGSSQHPRAVIGLFDPSARPWFGENILTFTAPMKKFAEMVEDMDESFLITPTWDRILQRIKRKSPPSKGVKRPHST